MPNNNPNNNEDVTRLYVDSLVNNINVVYSRSAYYMTPDGALTLTVDTGNTPEVTVSKSMTKEQAFKLLNIEEKKQSYKEHCLKHDRIPFVFANNMDDMHELDHVFYFLYTGGYISEETIKQMGWTLLTARQWRRLKPAINMNKVKG